MGELDDIEMSKPSVSIIIVTRNSQEYLTLTIESILRQDFKDLELILCDTGSTDQTVSISRSFEDNRLKLVSTIGCDYYEAFNFAKGFASGKYLLELGSSDIISPSFVHKAYDLLEKDMSAFSAIPILTTIDSNGIVLDKTVGTRSLKCAALKIFANSSVSVPPSGFFIRISAPFDTAFFREDLDNPRNFLHWKAFSSKAILFDEIYAHRKSELHYSKFKLRSKRSAESAIWKDHKKIISIIRPSFGLAGYFNDESIQDIGHIAKRSLRKFNIVLFVKILFFMYAKPGYRHSFSNALSNKENV